MLMEFSVAPMGVGESISKEVAKVIDLIDQSGFKYRTHAMGTLVEGSWEQCMAVIKQCHDACVRFRRGCIPESRSMTAKET